MKHYLDDLSKGMNRVVDAIVEGMGTPCILRKINVRTEDVYGDAIPGYQDDVYTKVVLRHEGMTVVGADWFVEDAMPIEAYFKDSDNVKVGDQIEFDYEVVFPRSNTRARKFDVVDKKAKNQPPYALIYVYTVAPVRS